MFIHQESYISQLIESFEKQANMILIHESRQVPLTRLIPRTMIENSKEYVSESKSKMYASFIAGVLYTSVSTRVDVSQAVSYLAQFTKSVTQQAWNSLVNLLSYLKQTKMCGICYRPQDQDGVVIYSDSDHNSEHDLVSRSAYVGFMNGSLVSWKSKKLASTISMSSCESEFYAAELAGAEAMYLRRLEFSLRTGRNATDESDMKQALIKIDNQAAIKVLQQDGFSNRTKHIEVRYLWIKKEVAKGRINLEYVPTHGNCADALTKPLVRGQLFKLLNLMGMRIRKIPAAAKGGECGDIAPLQVECLIALTSAGRMCTGGRDRVYAKLIEELAVDGRAQVHAAIINLHHQLSAGSNVL
jgi:hypothetical protein